MTLNKMNNDDYGIYCKKGQDIVLMKENIKNLQQTQTKMEETFNASINKIDELLEKKFNILKEYITDKLDKIEENFATKNELENYKNNINDKFKLLEELHKRDIQSLKKNVEENNTVIKRVAWIIVTAVIMALLSVVLIKIK